MRWRGWRVQALSTGCGIECTVASNGVSALAKDRRQPVQSDTNSALHARTTFEGDVLTVAGIWIKQTHQPKWDQGVLSLRRISASYPRIRQLLHVRKVAQAL